MRQARDQMLRMVAQHLTKIGFMVVGSDDFKREIDGQVLHVCIQNHTSGRNIRVISHATRKDSPETSIVGPWSDAYTRPDSPNGIRYNFHWTARDEDVARCAGEYCRFIADVLIDWFLNLNRSQSET